MLDEALRDILLKETKRQNEGLELIASENYPSMEVRYMQGSIFTAKYAEGYPGKRYYGGCEYIDEVENLAIERAKKLFNASYVNVQPHSGSQANFAAYHALKDEGATILSLTLNDGGHLTHGSPVSFSSHLYHFEHYPLGKDGKLDYDIIKERIKEVKPDIFLSGYSAYPFKIDFKKIREIIDEHNKTSDKHCYFMVDMAHIAGLVAAGYFQNPVEFADVVTSTTHKTLRGPRGGLILSNNESLFKKLNSAVFPYSQGGPLEHVIAGKAVMFLEDSQPKFKDYIAQVLKNTKAMNDEFIKLGRKASGTETHLFLLNTLDSYGLTGKEAETLLGEYGITVNKNMIHGDTMPPVKTSGIRIGAAALTSRGLKEETAIEIADLMDTILSKKGTEETKEKVKEIASKFSPIESLTYL